MSTILVEGFDLYGPNGVVIPNLSSSLAAGGWTFTNVYSNASLVSGLAGEGGYALSLSAVSYSECAISKTLPASYGRIIGGFRFEANLLTTVGLRFVDTSTAQFTIAINEVNGFITVEQGSFGTTLQQSTVSVAGNTVHYLEFDITFGNAGSWNICLDGVSILAGNGKTQQSSNASANLIQFVSTSSGVTGTFIFDDVYIFSSTGATNNAMLLSNPIVYSQQAIGDYQTQFTNLGNVFGNTYSIGSSSYASGANTLYLAAFTPNVSSTMIAVVLGQVNTTNATANIKGVIYADNAGSPGNLLSSGTQFTGISSGQEVELMLTSPQNLTAGVQYWIGYITDTNFNMLQFNYNLFNGQKANNTYSSGAPSTAPSMTGGQPSFYMFGLCTGATTNWESIALNPPIGDLSALASATAGIEDLYTFPALPTNTQSVYTVGVVANARVTYPGVHTFDLVTQSSGTSGNGNNTNIVATLSYANYASYFDVDPNTSAAWAVSAANAAYSGMEIVT